MSHLFSFQYRYCCILFLFLSLFFAWFLSFLRRWNLWSLWINILIIRLHQPSVSFPIQTWLLFFFSFYLFLFFYFLFDFFFLFFRHWNLWGLWINYLITRLHQLPVPFPVKKGSFSHFAAYYDYLFRTLPPFENFYANYSI